MSLKVPGASPLTIQTRFGQVIVSQSEVCVRQDSRGCRVSVFNGAVQLQPLQGAALTLRAGQQVNLQAAGAAAIQAFDVLQPGWREGVLMAKQPAAGGFPARTRHLSTGCPALGAGARSAARHRQFPPGRHRSHPRAARGQPAAGGANAYPLLGDADAAQKSCLKPVPFFRLACHSRQLNAQESLFNARRKVLPSTPGVVRSAPVVAPEPVVEPECQPDFHHPWLGRRRHPPQLSGAGRQPERCADPLRRPGRGQPVGRSGAGQRSQQRRTVR